jgi:hypothetical protein
MTPKEQYYKYGESLGISINDLQRLKMLADNCQEYMADKKYTEEDIRKAITFVLGIELWKEENQIEDYINSLNKQD